MRHRSLEKPQLGVRGWPGRWGRGVVRQQGVQQRARSPKPLTYQWRNEAGWGRGGGGGGGGGGGDEPPRISPNESRYRARQRNPGRWGPTIGSPTRDETRAGEGGGRWCGPSLLGKDQQAIPEGTACQPL